MEIRFSLMNWESWRLLMESEPSVSELSVVRADAMGSYQRATDLFQRALELAQVTQSSQMSWATTYLNLGTSYRKLK